MFRPLAAAERTCLVERWWLRQRKAAVAVQKRRRHSGQAFRSNRIRLSQYSVAWYDTFGCGERHSGGEPLSTRRKIVPGVYTEFRELSQVGRPSPQRRIFGRHS